MKVDDVAVLVSEDLDFDVLGSLDVALEEDGVVAEGILSFILGLFQSALEVGGLFDDAHAATATTKGGLDDEREADFVCYSEGLVGIRNGVVGSGEDGNLGSDGLGARGGFVAHGAEEVGGWSNEGDPFTGASAGEVGIFREESVAGMDESDAF